MVESMMDRYEKIQVFFIILCLSLIAILPAIFIVIDVHSNNDNTCVCDTCNCPCKHDIESTSHSVFPTFTPIVVKH